MGEVEVCKARPEDAVFIAGLLQAMGLASSVEHVRSRIFLTRESRNDAVLLARLDSISAGFAALHSSAIFHEPGCIGRIKALSVHPNHRRTGVGNALLSAAEDFFRGRGCIRMEVTSGEARETAHAFYEACGMQADLRRFVLHLN